jgi:hypothetical protein
VVGLKTNFTWAFDVEHHGQGPPFLESSLPVALTDGDGYKFPSTGTSSGEDEVDPDDLNVTGELQLSFGKFKTGWKTDPGDLVVLATGGMGTSLDDYVFNRFEATLENFFLKGNPITYASPGSGAAGVLTCGVGFTGVDGSVVAVDSDKVQFAGWELYSSRSLGKRIPFEKNLCSGSPSTVNFTDLPTQAARLDRYWPETPGYGDVPAWSGNGTVLEGAWPLADPAVTAGGGGFDLVTDHDAGGDAYPGSLTLRHLAGTANGLADGTFPTVDGALEPAVATANGTTAVAFTKVAPGADGVGSLHTGEIHLSVNDAGWLAPVQVTDDHRVDRGVDVAPLPGGGHVLAWISDPSSPLTPGDTQLRYAIVEDRTVRRSGVVADGDVAGPPALAPTEDGAVVAHAQARPNASAAGSPTLDARAAEITAEGVSDGLDLGDAWAVDAAPLDRNRTMVALGGPDEVGYAVLEDGSLAERGTVARESASEVELAGVPGKGLVILWPGQGATRFAVHAGAWTPPGRLLEGHRAGLSAAVDAEEGILYVASKHAQVPDPIRADAPVSLELDTFDVSRTLGLGTNATNATAGNATSGIPVNASDLQRFFDELPPRLRSRFANERVNVRVDRGKATDRVVGIRTEDEVIQEVGPGHESPSIVVETDRETVDTVRRSMEPSLAVSRALERGDIDLEGAEGGARDRVADAAERVGRALGRVYGNPTDVPPGEVRRRAVGGGDLDLGGTGLGYVAVLDDGRGDPDGAPEDGGSGEAPADGGAPNPWDGAGSIPSDARLRALDRDGVVRGFTTPAVQGLVQADPEGLSPDAGVYEDRPDILPDRDLRGSRAMPQLSTAEAADVPSPPATRRLQDGAVTIRTFAEPSRAPCGADEPGPRTVETVTGSDGALLLEGRHVDGERVLVLRHVEDGASRVLGACMGSGGAVDVTYTLHEGQIAGATFEHRLDAGSDARNRALKWTWDADAGTVSFQRGDRDLRRMATRAPPPTLDAFVDWVEEVS